jgi:hypothetical protein
VSERKSYVSGNPSWVELQTPDEPAVPDQGVVSDQAVVPDQAVVVA